MKNNTFIFILISFLLLYLPTGFAFSQDKPKLGILPVTGGNSEDGETIARLFSYQSDINNTFIIVPHNSAVNALIAEQKFQISGYTDSDTIVQIGRMLNVDYVVSGHIRRLGNSNLIITTIVDVETFEQLAGNYHKYENIEEVSNLMSTITKSIVTAAYKKNKIVPTLAIAPFSVANPGVNIHEAETLAQILAIEISNTGNYSVLPRTSSMQAAIKELEFQTSGYTAEESAKALGRAINAEYVLSGEVRKLGNMNMFTAQILNVEEGKQISGESRNYRIIDDGINLMAELALLLVDPKNAHARISSLNRQRSRTALFEDPARFWSIGINAGTSFAAPWLIGTINVTLAPFRYSFFEIGFDYGLISGNPDAEKYYSLYPFAHYALFLPINKAVNFFLGAGGGYMIGEYTFPEETIKVNIFAFDVTAGINLWNLLNVSYTLRTDLNSLNNKISLGVIYRFYKEKS